jgi:hypothetical protein
MTLEQWLHDIRLAGRAACSSRCSRSILQRLPARLASSWRPRLLAAYLLARRATRVDPVAILRAD